jgi:hypothetical protein
VSSYLVAVDDRDTVGSKNVSISSRKVSRYPPIHCMIVTAMVMKCAENNGAHTG